MYTDLNDNMRCIFHIDGKYSKVFICSVGYMYKTYFTNGINLAKGVIVVMTVITLQPIILSRISDNHDVLSMPLAGQSGEWGTFV